MYKFDYTISDSYPNIVQKSLDCPKIISELKLI